MSSTPTIEPFKGANWEECDDFIRAIRATAWKEGKIRDPSWIADFASLHFSRKARSWYSRLPQDVRQDWEKLEVALVDRWTSPEEDDVPPIEPTPAAAPSLNRSDKADHPLQGVLKLVIDGPKKNSYLKLNQNGFGEVTENANEALRFRCNSLSDTTLVERIDGSRHSSLGVHWGTADPNLKNGSSVCGYLVLVDSISLKASWGALGLASPVSCTVSANREVIPVWENSDTSKMTIGIYRDPSGILWVAADPDAYSKVWPKETRVKIFLEPID